MTTGMLNWEGFKWPQKAAVIFAVSAALGMAGCSHKEAAPAAESAIGPKEVSALSEAEEPVRLTVSVWDNAYSPQFQAMADAFMKKNPGIRVELIDIRSDEYHDKLSVMLAGADSDPDVLMIKDADTQLSMKDKGQLLDLTDYIARDYIDLNIYNGAAEQLMMDGRQYTLPFRQDWYVLYYNKDMFDQAGISYPGNDMIWPEYETLAERMTSGEGEKKIYGSHHHTWMALVANWAVQDGGNTLMNQDYGFLAPYYERAVRMQERGLVQDYAKLKVGNVHYISVFEQQQCAMLPMGTWFIATLVQDQAAGLFEFNWGVARIPHPEGAEAGSTVGSVTPIGVNQKTDVPETAWEFVKFAVSEEGAGILADNSVFPAITSQEVVHRLASIEGFPEDGKPALEVKHFVFDRPLDVKMSAVRKIIEDEHDAIMIGEKGIGDGIQSMNEKTRRARNP